ncbi:MAG: phosphotransferase [Acetobacteraceae bacterium]
METAETEAIARLPCWSGPVDIAPLAGGITNRNYLVRDPAQGRFVARIGADRPIHGILRWNERTANRAAAEAGVAPELLYAEAGILVSRFVDARTLDATAFADPAMLVRAARLIRRCHDELPRHLHGPALMFWPFHVNRTYLARLAQTGHGFGATLAHFAAANTALEEGLGPVRITFAHNDLLPANFLDDGSRLWLIDWEYAGFDTPLFDLANLAANAALGEAAEATLLAAWAGTDPSPAERRGFLALKCASALRETLWSAISEQEAATAFDYAAYTSENRIRFEAAWAAWCAA